MTTDRVVLGADPAAGGVALDVLDHVLGVGSTLRYDWVVCAVPPEPEDDLWHALRDGDVPVHRIGDCLAPRRAHAAVLDGHRVGMEL